MNRQIPTVDRLRLTKDRPLCCEYHFSTAPMAVYLINAEPYCRHHAGQRLLDLMVEYPTLESEESK